jgi:phosphoglycerate kinase
MGGFDIGPKNHREFGEAILKAKTIFWNGPVGLFEVEQFSTEQ